MASFETGFVIRPAEEFAQRVALAATRPQAYQLYERLSEAGVRQKWKPDARLDGTWLVCGQDDFGRLLAERLRRDGVATRIIAENGDKADWPAGSVLGPSSEAETLQQAGVDEVTGIIVAHANDAENLSTIMTGLMLNPDLLVIARENHLHNRQLFEEAGTHLTCSVSGIVASAMRPVLEASMVPDFFEAMLERDEDWSRECLQRLRDRIGDERVQFWSSRISEKRTPPLAEVIQAGEDFTAGMLTLDPHNRNEKMDALVLMILREEEVLLAPGEDEPLAMGDRILFCGTPHSAELIWAVAVDPDVVRYLRTGQPRLARQPWWRRALTAKKSDA